MALALFALVFLVMIYAVIPFEDMGLPLPAFGWWYPELSALFLVGGIAIGLIYGLGEEETADAFVSGAADLLGVAFIIGISRGITVLMNNGSITDTILHWGEQVLGGAGSVGFVLLVFLLYLPLSILIPSSSGLATLSIPVMAPLGRFAGIDESLLEHYGKVKAKIDTRPLRDLPRKGKLILVTAINPTPAGEGKTTTSVGLSDALRRLGKNTILCLREPSLGPVFGIKGGAAGGGYAQVVPMEDINTCSTERNQTTSRN